ncbi:hypothetical protein [Paraburkholderia youngii]|uniref:hypothetical protein n=1 Tax=Paraburkholderia youngii TaxID=2782701 RepID=UPI003D24F508
MKASTAKKTPKKKVSGAAAPAADSPAGRRLARARAREDLAPPTPDEILEFQLSFLRRSNLLIYTTDAAIIQAARSVKPDNGEKLASYLERAFGSKKADVLFAQFMNLDGRSAMKGVVLDNAGREMKSLLALGRREAKDAVEETRAELAEAGKKRVKRVREKALEQQAAERQRLSQFPAEWLEDRAQVAQEENDSAGGTKVHDARVIAKLRDIARDARQQAQSEGSEGAPLEDVVDRLIAAYDGMARHESQQAERIRQLEAELAAARRAA